MKNILRFGLLIVAWLAVLQPLLGQEQDSIGKSEALLSPSFELKWEQMSALPLKPYLIQEQFGKSSLALYQQNGDFITAQQPEREWGLKVQSEGIREVNGFWMEGGFSYQKVFSDSMGWRLSRELASNPYYIGNIKKGNWDKDYFDLYMKVAKPLWNDRILLGLGIDYQLQKHARYNDPRIEINSYQLDMDGQLGYRIGKGQFAAVNLGFGNADDKGGYRYYDENNESFGAAEYVVYNLYGLGSYDLVKRTRYIQTLNEKRLGIQYNIHRTGWNINEEFTYSSSSSNYERRITNGGETIIEDVGDYKLHASRNRLYVELRKGKWNHQLVSLSTLEKGKDYNKLFLGGNYFYDRFCQELSYQASDYVSRFSIKGTAFYNQVSKKDFNASHEYDYANAGLEVEVQKGIKINEVLYRGTLAANYRYNLNGQVRVNPQYENIVSQSVVYPEWSYQTANFISPMAQVSAEKSLEKLTLRGSLRYQSEIATKVNEVSNSIYLPEGRRNYINFTITVLH
ncbi:hypothetical protein DN752_09035 [Echinicola strongylocentroti]|uniref:DUF6850 domain-containing protein n=1 Tax=Echinicola strongylocentroti TaxID=1795355 RepID=A0A2Z4II69_9BACT|nr:DUF6850 family outer membrane beta-barrel protein [Echinicola strongylocentroti]AWW30256.1 hypothetical protein DN752_09035 [Echinicola strongylocentroti]